MSTPKSEQRRSQLINAAVKVISERGIAGASVRAIAEEAGVSAASVLYHFDSVEALIDTAIQGAIAEFTDSRRSLAKAHTTPIDQLRAVIYAGIPETISDELRIVYNASSTLVGQEKFGALILALTERQVALFHSIIEVGVALDAFQPALDSLEIAETLVALEDAYDLYLLHATNWQRERYLSNTLRVAETLLRCTLTHTNDPSATESDQ